MKTRLILTTLALGVAANAATLTVLPGTSIQAKVNLAQPGDTIAIFGGTYNEDVTIDKSLRLAEVSGHEVTLAGNVTFSGLTDPPALEGFAVGSPGRGVKLVNTTGMVLRNLVGTGGSLCQVNGTSAAQIVDCNLEDVSTSGTGTLKMWNSQFNNLTPGGTSAEVWSCTGRGMINQTAGTLHTAAVTVAGDFNSGTTAQKTVAFRTTITGDVVWQSKKAWFGYSAAHSFSFTTNSGARVVVVGCEIDRKGGYANGISLSGTNNSFAIHNNTIVGVAWAYWSGSANNGVDLRGIGNKATIANNYCKLTQTDGYYLVNRGAGVLVSDTIDVTIINNLIEGALYTVSAPFGVTAKNNLAWASPLGAYSDADGVVTESPLYADPLFVENEAPKLQPASPCINGGTPDPRYNDRDGSRNDIGPSGGALFDPDGWTTENPVVLSFDLSPDMVLEGADAEILLSEGQAVSMP